MEEKKQTEAKKKELSAFELSFIAREMQELTDGKVDKIYQISNEEFLFQFHVPNKGRKMLKIILPSMIFFTKNKPETPEKPMGFCMFLRKYLNNARIREVKQKGFERIIELGFSTKDAQNNIVKYILVIELFRKGNIILCDESMKIISPLETQRWSGREIRKGEKYKLPELRKNPFSLDRGELKEMFDKSDKESVVKFLAIELGLGGVYAEEICLRAGIDKNETPKKAKPEAAKIFTAIGELKEEAPAPKSISKNEKPIDIIPIELKHYKTYTKTDFATYSEALDSQLTVSVEKKQVEKVSKHEKEIKRVEVMIKEQEKTVQNFTQSYEENQRKAEFIYENYQQINELLEQIRKAREKHSWREIKEKLKNHKVVRDINEKDGKITIELGGD